MRQTKREYVIEFFSKELNSERTKVGKNVFFRYTTKTGRACLAQMSATGYKPYRHEVYTTIEERDAAFARFVEYEKQITEQQQKNSSQFWQNIKIGTILYSTWGYEQTNINYYIVTDITQNFVWLQEISATGKETVFMSGTCVPNTENIVGEPIKKKISKKPYIKLSSYEFLSIWDGRPVSYSSYA